MKIRELKAKDVRTLARMFGQLKPDSLARVQAVLGAAREEEATPEQTMKVGMNLIQVIAEVTDEIWGWLADLAGTSAEELDEMPFDTPKLIVQQLIEGGQFADFFTSALKSAPKTKRGSGTP